MSTTKGRRVLLAAVLALGAPDALRAQTPLGSAFTYQGRLTDGAVPANGPYDLEVRLFSAASGGAAVGPTVVRDDVSVTDGLFTVGLDFGAAAFEGSARWLELAVRPGASTGAYTTLAPRQELTASPNALFASAAPWSGLLDVPAGFADGTDDDSGGDITSVAAGTGLTGGATTGDATLAVDGTVVQSRVAGQCAPGQSIRVVNQDGTVACEPDDTGWALAGNAGTDPATQFLGTTDAQPLVLRANNAVALRLSRGPVLPNLIGGSTQNSVTAGVDAATIAGGGGGTSDGANRVTDHYGVVGGGYGNLAGNDVGTASDAQFAAVAGGLSNRATGGWATVGGGNSNVASGASSSVGGGSLNQALAEDATVAGGEGNVARGTASAVPGGFSNTAGGDQSFAGGFRATVRDAAASGDSDGDEGTFVWADTTPPFAPFVSTGPNQFLVRAAGGVGINTNAPAVPLDVDGVIRSRTGGFRFPDGTTQTTAATGGGDITAVNTPLGGGLAGGAATGAANLTLLTCSDTSILKRVAGSWACMLDEDSGGTVTAVTAGTGLTGGTITTSGTLGVAFAGNGSAATAARSDHQHDATYAPASHDHMGETWTDTTAVGLRVQTSAPASRGLWVDNAAVDGAGLYTLSSAASGTNYGVYAQTASPDGRGLVGFVTATNGAGFGVQGASSSSSGVGVQGVAGAPTGTTTGVWGQSDSTVGRGVYGLAAATAGQSRGVWGDTSSTQGVGVFGRSTALTGQGIGVFGTAFSTLGTGVLGSGQTGVWGITNLSTGQGMFADATSTTGATRGLFAQALSTGGYGVYGVAFASGGPALGVRGDSLSSNGSGVMGAAFSSAGFGTGVSGRTLSTSGNGVSGIALDNFSLSQSIGVRGEVVALSSTAYGVAGFAPSPAYAGFFSGRVQVTGLLSKGGGSFKIDHPLDPENRYLYHSFVESPDMKNIYDGVATTDAEGFATVSMPDWFEALNRDFRYQLTVIGDGAWARARVYRRLQDGRFVIQTDLPGVEVSWQLTGIRKDPFAEANRIPVEEEKPDGERGRYLHPEAWGRPEEEGVHFAARQRGAATSAELEPAKPR
jgi:hypothetical protein